MDLGERLRQSMATAGVSQAELARRIGISQPSVSYLAKNGARGSKHLRAIARELGVTEAYLEGRTDDERDAKESATNALPLQVMMPITLPPVEALERGFLAVLMASRQMGEAALAHELAVQLPTLLSVLQGPLRVEPAPSAPAAAPADDYPAKRRA